MSEPEDEPEELRRARPTNALGGTPKKDHLFGEDMRSKCDSWMYNGGRVVDSDEVDEDDPELCARCARSVT